MIIRVAFRALVRNKMRAALTMLGIIIGVAAVIAMVSIGQGASASVQAQTERLDGHAERERAFTARCRQHELEHKRNGRQ